MNASDTTLSSVTASSNAVTARLNWLSRETDLLIPQHPRNATPGLIASYGQTDNPQRNAPLWEKLRDWRQFLSCLGAYA
jgi:hypothetical protein